MMQTQIQALLAERGEGEVKAEVLRPNTESNIEVAKLKMFNGTASKVSGFLIVCRLYIKMKMRDIMMEEQVQQVLSYVQGGLAGVWKENMIEDLESRSLSYITISEFLSDLKEEFSSGDDKMIKVTELKKIEQGSKTIEKFVQEFRRAAKESRYERRLLVEEFKREINEMIRRKLMEVEKPLRNIDQQYECATNLDRH